MRRVLFLATVTCWLLVMGGHPQLWLAALLVTVSNLLLIK